MPTNTMYEIRKWEAEQAARDDVDRLLKERELDIEHLKHQLSERRLDFEIMKWEKENGGIQFIYFVSLDAQ